MRLHYISRSSGVIRINLVPLVIFGNGGLGESPCTINFVGKWWTQMHKKANLCKLSVFLFLIFLFWGLNVVRCQTSSF